MFRRKQVYHQEKVRYFFATDDVMLTSYFCVCKLWVLPQKTTFDKMLTSQQKVVEQQVCAKCFQTIHRQLNIDGIKCLNKKLTRPAVSSHSTDSGQVVIHAVMQC